MKQKETNKKTFKSIMKLINFILSETGKVSEYICPVPTREYENNGGRTYYGRSFEIWMREFINNYIAQNDVVIVFRQNVSGHGYALGTPYKLLSLRASSFSNGQLHNVNGSGLPENIAYLQNEFGSFDRRSNYMVVRSNDNRMAWRAEVSLDDVRIPSNTNFQENECEITVKFSDDFFMLASLKAARATYISDLKAIKEQTEEIEAKINNLNYVIKFMEKGKLNKELKSIVKTNMILDTLNKGKEEKLKQEEISSEINEIISINV